MSNFCASCGISKDSVNNLQETEKKEEISNTYDYILYSTNCPKCKILEKKMEDVKINFVVSNDVDKMMELGFMSAPVLYSKKEDKYMAFATAVKYINELSKEEE